MKKDEDMKNVYNVYNELNSIFAFAWLFLLLIFSHFTLLAELVS